MRKLLAGIVVAVSLFALTSCGQPSLTSQEKSAVAAVEQNVNQLGPETYGSTQVIGSIAKDALGNKVTFVYVPVTDKSAPKGQQAWTLVIVIVENPSGQLVFADATVPSGMVTVVGNGQSGK